MSNQAIARIITTDYQNKIYHLALSVTRNEKDAEDVLQNTLIKIIRNYGSFRNRSKLSTWIYRIAYNESLMYLRKKRRLLNSANAYKNYNERLPQDLLVNWSRLPDQQLLDDELRQRIDSTLRGLPIAYRMPLLLHRIERLSLIETGRILNIRPSTVKTRLHRAYLMVREEIKDYYLDKEEHPLAQDLTCGVWTGFIHNYALAALDAAKRASFNRHIRDCPNCTSFLNSYLKAIRITNALDCRDIPPELKEKIKTFLST